MSFTIVYTYILYKFHLKFFRRMTLLLIILQNINIFTFYYIVFHRNCSKICSYWLQIAFTPHFFLHISYNSLLLNFRVSYQTNQRKTAYHDHFSYSSYLCPFFCWIFYKLICMSTLWIREAMTFYIIGSQFFF